MHGALDPSPAETRRVAAGIDASRVDVAQNGTLAVSLPPDAADDAVAIWDLTRVRARIAALGPTHGGG
jgi:hypothetical protein